MATPEDLVELTSDQGVEVEDKREDREEQFARLYREILETPGRMDEDTLLRAVMSMAARRAETQGEEAADRYADNLAEALALGWTDLQDLPLRNHDDVWRDAVAVLSAVAHRQAHVETGLAVALVEGGVDAELRVAPLAKALGLKGLKKASKLGKTKKIREKQRARKAAKAAEAEANG